MDKVTFEGFERPDGLVGIRNHLAVVPTVACANGVVAAIAREVPQAVPIFHGHGCGRGGRDLELHYRTLSRLVMNPNIAAAVLVGLGCEVIRAEALLESISACGKEVDYLNIQETGGSRWAAEKGARLTRRLLRDVSRQKRKRFPLSEVIMGLECGGSDAFSGVTANPSVGLVADWLVQEGGTVILTESTEMIGTAHILRRRSADEEVAQRVESIIEEAERRTKEILGPLAAYVIAPGNMDGGVSSIMEKSLGCILKGGNSPVVQVVDYAEHPSKKGLVIMDGPGYDVESMTGLAAAGCQLMVFTTGRGNPIGFPVVPVIKVASTRQLYKKMEDDMDIDAGVVLEGKALEDVASIIRKTVMGVLNGEPTKAELNQQDGIVCFYTTGPSF